MSLFLLKRRTVVRIGCLDLPAWCPEFAAEECADYITAHSRNLRGMATNRGHEKNAHLTDTERAEADALIKQFVKTF